MLLKGEKVMDKHEESRQLEEIAKELSKEIIREMMPDIRKQLKREILKDIKREREKKILHNTYVLMKNYNKFKQHIKINNKSKISNVDEYLNDIELNMEEIELDLADEKFIKSILKSKIRTATMISFIDEALAIVKKEYKSKRKEEKYKAFEMFFMKENSNKEISEKLYCSINTPKKWSNEVLKDLSLLLWGIDALNELIA